MYVVVCWHIGKVHKGDTYTTVNLSCSMLAYWWGAQGDGYTTVSVCCVMLEYWQGDKGDNCTMVSVCWSMLTYWQVQHWRGRGNAGQHRSRAIEEHTALRWAPKTKLRWLYLGQHCASHIWFFRCKPVKHIIPFIITLILIRENLL